MKGMHRHRSRWSGRIGIVVLLLASLLPVLSAQSVGAAAITVDSLGDGAAVAANCMVGHAVGTCRLRDALAAAGTGGAITFAVSGTINVNQAQGPLTLALNVTIDGTGATITVDGGCTGCDPGGTPTGGVTVFRVNSGVTAAISSLTIQHGNSSGFGGGIANNGGTLTVTSSTFSANSAPSGGGIANFGTLTVTNGDFSGNSAPNGVGGGIANEIGTLTVTDSFFSTNSASIGGGIYNNGGTLMVARSQFSANATSGGGGITNDNSGNVTVTNGVFSGNSAGSGVGGGIDNRNGGTLTVTSSIFSGNSAFRGGGIYTTGTLAVMNSTLSGNMATGAGGANTGGGIEEEGGAITVTNSIFANNSATGSGGGGGGIEQAEGTLTLTNVTFSGNTSDGGGGIEMSGTGALTVTNSTFSNNAGGTFGGGGILRDDTGAVTVTNSTFSANSGTTGGALFNDNSGPLTLTNTIIAGNTGGNCATALGGTIGDGGHNLQFGDTSCGATIPVQNPQLGMLADNGGTAATVLPNGSHAPTFAITTGSPAFNHGDPAICTAPLPPTGTGAGSMDERGFPRGNGTAGNPSCSIGAFEPQSAAVTITLSPTTLPAASGGIPYSQTLTATGGTAPYTFTVTMGTLPTGLSLSTGGLLSGTPTAGGTFSFTIQAKDANGVTGSQAYTLSVTTPTITLSPATLPGGVRSVAYPATTLAAAGGTAPYTFTVTTGMLPTGLMLSPSGLLSGTPTAGGTFTFTVTATDANGFTGMQQYTITVSTTAPPTLKSIALTGPGGTPPPTTLKVGQSVAITATGTFSDGSTQNLSTQVQWSSSNATVAKVDTTGTVTGESPGTATISATLNGVSQSFTVTVGAPTPIGITVQPAPASRPSGMGIMPPGSPAPAAAPVGR